MVVLKGRDTIRELHFKSGRNRIVHADSRVGSRIVKETGFQGEPNRWVLINSYLGKYLRILAESRVLDQPVGCPNPCALRARRLGFVDGGQDPGPP